MSIAWTPIFKFWPVKLTDRTWSGFCTDLQACSYWEPDIPAEVPSSFGVCYRQFPGFDSGKWYYFCTNRRVTLYDGTKSRPHDSLERCRTMSSAAAGFIDYNSPCRTWVYRPQLIHRTPDISDNIAWFDENNTRKARPLIDGTWSKPGEKLEYTCELRDTNLARDKFDFCYRRRSVKSEEVKNMPKLTIEKRFAVINGSDEIVSTHATLAEAITDAESKAKPECPRWVIELIARAKVTMPVVVTNFREEEAKRGVASVANNT